MAGAPRYGRASSSWEGGVLFKIKVLLVEEVICVGGC